MNAISKCIITVVGSLCLGLLSGCQSAREPGSSSHAVVQIDGHTLTEIQNAAAEVFGEEGYSLSSRTATMMMFHRPGSRREVTKYGGWSTDGVTMRVRLAISELAANSHRLQADAYVEQNTNDPFFSEENRALMLNRAPYRHMLQDVAKRLE